jgi:hypothetical protein
MSNSASRTPFVIGKGTIVEIALLPVGSTTEPVRVPAITSDGTITAKDTASPATITLSAALGAGVLIAAGNYLGFKDPVTGKVVPVQLTADAKTGDTTLTVDIIPEAIAASSVASFPMRLSGRSKADLDRKGNRVTAVDFESSGYSSGSTVSIEQNIKLDGNWLPQDPGFATAEYAFGELREVYIWLTLPKISDAYSKGRVYHGPTSLTSLPLGIGAADVVTGNIEAAYNGRPSYNPDTPAT